MFLRSFLVFLVPWWFNAAAHAQTAEKPEAAAKEAPKPDAPPPQNVGGLDPTPDAGTISGIIRFEGTPPPREPIREVGGNAYCHEQHQGGEPLQEAWVFGKNGDAVTVGNVLVHVSKGLQDRTFKPPERPVLLDQSGCVYRPHVVALMAGQPLEIRNSDATLHNVMANARKNVGFNEGMSTKGGVLRKVFPLPELKIEFKCFMHPWMNARVHVLAHPYFAVTRDDGAFTLRGLPPGEYEVAVVQESSLLQADPARIPVKVAAGETKKVDFTYRAPR